VRCSAQSARSTARGAKRRPLLHLQELSAARRTSLVHCAGPQGSGPARSRGAPARLADWQAAGEPPTESLTFPRKISCPDSGKGAKSIFKPIRDAHGNFHECVRVSLALRFTVVLPNASAFSPGPTIVSPGTTLPNTSHNRTHQGKRPAAALLQKLRRTGASNRALRLLC
jgi:hypothetical protein